MIFDFTCPSCTEHFLTHVLGTQPVICPKCEIVLCRVASEGGTVYILSNASMPGTVKIGKTERHIQERLDELQTTGVPTPFVCEALFAAIDHTAAERCAHAHLKVVRVHPNREFFNASREDAIRSVQTALGYGPYYIRVPLVSKEQREKERIRQEEERKNEKEMDELRPRAQTLLSQMNDSIPSHQLRAIALDRSAEPLARLLAMRIYLEQFPGDLDVSPALLHLAKEFPMVADVVWRLLKR